MGRQDFETETMVAFPLTAGMAASAASMPNEQGALTPVAFNPKMGGDPTMGAGVINDGTAYTLDASGNSTAVAFDMRGREGGAQFEGPHDTANIRAASGGSSKSYVAQEWAVRRLTPTECERLQGFPDGFTNVPWGKKDTSPDGPRYKALGNSMAVNVMRWIGRRIEMVEKITKETAA
ncbi:MAG: DNA methyltransferase [Shinella sp.]|nr:MAG: DNA methyltransferase [Shinella sp.]